MEKWLHNLGDKSIAFSLHEHILVFGCCRGRVSTSGDAQIAIFPSGNPNQTPTRRRVFATSSTADEKDVEGNTFHAYSIPRISVSLTESTFSIIEVPKTQGLLEKDWIPRPPGQERYLLRIPCIKLVMKRTGKYNANQI